MRRNKRVVAAWAGGVIGLTLVGSGCELPAKKAEINAPTQTDRMLLAYPEIQSGRLLILADFEDERQMGLFRLESTGDAGGLVRDPKKGRPETGLGALAAPFSDPADAVVVTSPREGEAFLKRDWRPYDLLTIAVHSPTAGLMLKTGIVGGVSGQTVETQTDTTLSAGWNFLRFDLAEVGEQVPLDDIREIRLGLAHSTGGPVTLYFDDLLLIGNRQNLMGDPANTSGKLYVQIAGRHWNIGVPGKFEIAFRNGQITRWFNLASDSYRLRNLVRGTALGPVPVLIEGGRLSRMALGNGEGVAARQRIVEMNDVRVVVECEWGQPGARKNGAFERRVYTVYPSGQVFAEAAGDPASQAMALNLAWSPNAPLVRIQSGVKEVATSSGDSPSFALMRIPEADAAMLFIPYPDNSGVELREIADADLKTTSLVWSRRGGPDEITWRGQIYLGSSSALDDSQVFSRAVDYVEPGGVRVEVGAAASTKGFRSDGYDPGAGAYVLNTDGKRVRAVVVGRKRAVFAPVFLLSGGTSEETWVYVNHLVRQDVHRGPDGELLFQLPDIAMKEVVVEALFKR